MPSHFFGGLLRPEQRAFAGPENALWLPGRLRARLEGGRHGPRSPALLRYPRLRSSFLERLSEANRTAFDLYRARLYTGRPGANQDQGAGFPGNFVLISAGGAR